MTHPERSRPSAGFSFSLDEATDVDDAELKKHLECLRDRINEQARDHAKTKVRVGSLEKAHRQLAQDLSEVKMRQEQLFVAASANHAIEVTKLDTIHADLDLLRGEMVDVREEALRPSRTRCCGKSS